MISMTPESGLRPRRLTPASTPRHVSQVDPQQQAVFGILEESSDLVAYATAGGSLSFANRAWREALGYTAGEAACLPASAAVAPEARAAFAAACARLLAAGGGAPAMERTETTLLAKDGRRLAAAGTLHRQAGPGGSASVCAVLRAVPDERALAGDRAEWRREFLSRVAHELRTPLTAVHGALGLMRAGGTAGRSADAAAGAPAGGSALVPEPELLELLRLARNGTDRLVWLVEDWMDLAELEAGALRLTRVPISAASLVEAAVERTAAAAARRGVRVAVAVEARRALRGDAVRLTRALAHLLDDALALAPRGSRVAVAATDAPGGGVRLTVEGPANAPRTRTTDPGFALCRALIEHHGGRVVVDTAGLVMVELPG